jgi:hypothetical protein
LTNPYQRVGRSTVTPFSRPPSRPGTGTSGSASFQSFGEQDEPEPEPEPEQPEPTDETDETTSRYRLDPETLTWLSIEEPKQPKTEPEPEPEPTTNMAPGGSTTNPPMDVDHEGKSYLKKPESFDGNRRKVDDFIYACDLFFEGSSDKDFPTDKQKIIFILSYMSEGETQ